MKKNAGMLLLIILLFALSPLSAQASQDLSSTASYVRRVAGAPGFSERLDWPILALVGAWEKVDDLIRIREQQVRRGELFNSLRSTDYHRTIVGAVAAGKNPKDFGGYNLIQSVKESQLPSGKFGDIISGEGEKLINAHIWGILSLYVAGEPIPNSSRALSWLVNNQNADGGFSVEKNMNRSDVDMTAMALLAFAALGRDAQHPAVKKALDYLKTQQQENGDFSPWSGGGPETVAQVIQGLIMLGIDPAGAEWTRTKGDLVPALLRYRRPDGSFSRSPGGESDFIATYQSLAALGDLQRGVSIYTLLHRKNAGFSDLGPGHRSFSDVSELVFRMVLSGYPDGTFRPDNPVRRDEFAKMIVVALGKQSSPQLTTTWFTDVPASHWANPYIRVAFANNLIKGKGERLFAPGDTISGAEVMAILVRALGVEPGTQANSGEAWYEGFLRIARDKGLLYQNFQATRPATRAQCAFSIMRLLEQF